MNGSSFAVDRRALLGSGLAGLASTVFLPDRVAAAAMAAKHKSQASLDYTTGHYQPTLTELSVDKLEVTGTIPPELSGRYFRNGHNPKPENTPPYWFEGNGMIHGVRIKGGRAEWYRNRWVRTPALHGAPLIRPDKSVDLTASAAATSVYSHAGRIYALQEVNLPFLVGPDLQTLGPFDFGGKLKQSMTAHPKIDQKTGEMLFMSYGPVAPHLTYFRVSPIGDLTHVENIPGAGPSIMHDFAVTPNYVLFLDSSVVFDPASKLAFPYKWDDNYQSRLGVMPRDRSKGPIKWIPVEPNFYFHISNAWEEPDGTLRMENTFYDKAGWDKFSKWLMSKPGHLNWLVQGDKFARWTIAEGRARVARDADRHLVRLPDDQPDLSRPPQPLHLCRGVPERCAEAQCDHQDRRPDRRDRGSRVPGRPATRRAVVRPRAERHERGRRLAVQLRRRRAHQARRAPHSRRQAHPCAAGGGDPGPGWVPAGVHGSWIDDAVLRV